MLMYRVSDALETSGDLSLVSLVHKSGHRARDPVLRGASSDGYHLSAAAEKRHLRIGKGGEGQESRENNRIAGVSGVCPAL